jgi:hypothetical protein
LIKQTVSAETVIALDPGYIPKAGKSTYGRGRYWSGVAGAAKWGLDICGFAVVDIINHVSRLNLCACLLSNRTRQKIKIFSKNY